MKTLAQVNGAATVQPSFVACDIGPESRPASLDSDARGSFRDFVSVLTTNAMTSVARLATNDDHTGQLCNVFFILLWLFAAVCQLLTSEIK